MRDKYKVLRRIKASGCPIEVEVPSRESQSPLIVIQTDYAYLFDLGTRGAAVALWVRLAREKPGQISIVDFGDVYAPEKLGVEWLDGPAQSCLPVYRLPNGFDFPSDSVLNERLGEGGLFLRSGRCVEGLILGTTWDRIPEKHSHGSILNARFSLVDALGHEFRGPVRFAVDRSTARVNVRRSARPGAEAPGESRLERAVDQLEQPGLDTSSQRDRPSSLFE